jgi:hypothetical protein
MKCLCDKDNDGKDPCSLSLLYKSDVETKKLDSWSAITNELDQLIKLTQAKNDDFLFRGQSRCSWGLQTPLERSFDAIGSIGKPRREIEGGLVRLFKRQFPQFRMPVPDDGNYLEWVEAGPPGVKSLLLTLHHVLG